MYKQKGNSLLAVLVIVSVGLGAYFLLRPKSPPVPTGSQSSSSSKSSESSLETPPSDLSEEVEADEVALEISDFSYVPKEIIVSPGTIIRVTNQDSVGHDVTSDDGTSFKTSLLGKGESATFTAPSTPGKYPFHCSPHPYMKATLTVQ